MSSLVTLLYLDLIIPSCGGSRWTIPPEGGVTNSISANPSGCLANGKQMADRPNTRIQMSMDGQEELQNKRQKKTVTTDKSSSLDYGDCVMTPAIRDNNTN